jgi:hypothetical protein
MSVHQTDESALRALFERVEPPASLEARCRDRIAEATPAAAVKPLRSVKLDETPVTTATHEPVLLPVEARHQAHSWTRAIAAGVAFIAIAGGIAGVASMDRRPPTEPNPTVSPTSDVSTTTSSIPPSGDPQASSSAALPPGSQPGLGQGAPPAAQPPAPKPTNAPSPPSRPRVIAGWPSSANVGVPPGTSLRSQPGDLHITTRGAVISDLRVDGSVYVEAPDVTLRRVLVAARSGADAAVLQTTAAPRLTIEDSEISGVGAQYGLKQEARGLQVLRSHLHGASTTVAVTSDFTAVDNYLDSVLANGNTSGVLLRHNTIRELISLNDWDGPITDVTIENNQLGFIHSTSVVILAPTGADSRDLRVIDNKFHQEVRPVSGWDPSVPGNVWTGNVWFETGAPVNP